VGVSRKLLESSLGTTLPSVAPASLWLLSNAESSSSSWVTMMMLLLLDVHGDFRMALTLDGFMAAVRP
jgi:hypothetical protein